MKGKGGVSAVAWWMGWIALSILSFFAAAAFWTGYISRNYGPMERQGAPVIWICAVFGTWMVLLIPLIVIMYRKVDKAYEESRITREAEQGEVLRRELGVKFLGLEASQRRLDRFVARSLKHAVPLLRNGHLVSARLKDGRRVENLFVVGREVLGVYGRPQLDFAVRDIIEVVPVGPEEPLPEFIEEGWLRLD